MSAADEHLASKLDEVDPFLGSIARLEIAQMRLSDEAVLAVKLFRAHEVNPGAPYTGYVDEWNRRLDAIRAIGDRLLDADTVRVPVVDQPVGYVLPDEMPGCRHRAEDACAACVPDLAPAALVDNRRAEVERLGGAS